MRKNLVLFFAWMVMPAALLFGATPVKLGHLNSQELLSIMPEMTAANTELQAFGKSLQEQFDKLNQDFQQKTADYQKDANVLSEANKQTRMQELQAENARLSAFNQDAQNQMGRKRDSLLQPVMAKANQAIKDVAVEGGYQYIFDTNGGTLLYAGESDDVLPLIKAKLGIK